MLHKMRLFLALIIGITNLTIIGMEESNFTIENVVTELKAIATEFAKSKRRSGFSHYTKSELNGTSVNTWGADMFRTILKIEAPFTKTDITALEKTVALIQKIKDDSTIIDPLGMPENDYPKMLNCLNEWISLIKTDTITPPKSASLSNTPTSMFTTFITPRIMVLSGGFLLVAGGIAYFFTDIFKPQNEQANKKTH